jgi:hypothetical protein
MRASIRGTSIDDLSAGPTGLEEIFNSNVSRGGGRGDLALGCVISALQAEDTIGTPWSFVFH